VRILIADDEAPARARLRRLIGELGVGEIVGESATGRETLAAVETTRPDLVLLDIRMPEGDGLSVARGLLRLEPPPAVVFVTALADRALAALEAGAAAYLVKPASREETKRRSPVLPAAKRCWKNPSLRSSGNSRRIYCASAATSWCRARPLHA
jgi:two-component system response regulator AlgR